MKPQPPRSSTSKSQQIQEAWRGTARACCVASPGTSSPAAQPNAETSGHSHGSRCKETCGSGGSEQAHRQLHCQSGGGAHNNGSQVSVIDASRLYDDGDADNGPQQHRRIGCRPPPGSSGSYDTREARAPGRLAVASAAAASCGGSRSGLISIGPRAADAFRPAPNGPLHRFHAARPNRQRRQQIHHASAHAAAAIARKLFERRWAGDVGSAAERAVLAVRGVGAGARPGGPTAGGGGGACGSGRTWRSGAVAAGGAPPPATAHSGGGARGVHRHEGTGRRGPRSGDRGPRSRSVDATRSGRCCRRNLGQRRLDGPVRQSGCIRRSVHRRRHRHRCPRTTGSLWSWRWCCATICGACSNMTRRCVSVRRL
jgi:hypothetical protein